MQCASVAAVTLAVPVPGLPTIELDLLLLDVNGTLTNRGELLDGVAERITTLRALLDVHLVSADTFGTLDELAARLDVHAVRAATGEDKLQLLEALGAARAAVIGNGANDVLVLEASALGIAVIGPEGMSAAAFRAADVICRAATEALDLLQESRALSATLRA
jgi:P-type E1-E2 ATPase